MTGLEILIGEARRLLTASPGAQQVIVVRSVKGNVYHFTITHAGASGDENRFLDGLLERDDAVIAHLVCMWHNFQIDVPSMGFRKRILALSPENAAAEVLLQDGYGLVSKRLERLV